MGYKDPPYCALGLGREPKKDRPERTPPQGWGSYLIAESVASPSDNRDICWFAIIKRAGNSPLENTQSTATSSQWHGCAKRVVAQREPHTEGVRYRAGQEAFRVLTSNSREPRECDHQARWRLWAQGGGRGCARFLTDGFFLQCPPLHHPEKVTLCSL